MTTAASKPLTARIEVFRPGTFTPMKGDPISFSAADLRAIADAYDPATAPAPIVVGHPSTDAPAFGWSDSFEYDDGEQRLYANLNQIEPAFAEMVKAGRLKKVSMQFFSPSQANNPVPGTWYPKHVGFLGAAAPAVPGLKNIQFAGEEGVTFEASFGAPGAEEAASLFRKLRDLLIEKFGLDDADKALPSWQIEWLDDQPEVLPHPGFSEGGVTPPFSVDANGVVVIKSDRFVISPPQQPKETAVSTQPDPAFAEREAALSAREKAIADREKASAHADNAAFAEKLVADGKLLPVSQGKVTAILNALPDDTSVSFAEGGEKLTPAAAIREVLEAQPKIVSFGEEDLGDDPAIGKPASFASDGAEVDPEGLKIHNKALAHQRQHPGMAYLDAVAAVS